MNAGFLGRHGAPALLLAAAGGLWLWACGCEDGGGMSAPVSIWTTCLKEAVSAWTKVVGKGVVSMVRGTGLGDGGSGLGRWLEGDAAEDGEEEEVEEDGELGSRGAMGRSCLGAATSIVGWLVSSGIDGEEEREEKR